MTDAVIRGPGQGRRDRGGGGGDGRALPAPDPDLRAAALSAEQRAVADTIVEAVEARRFDPMLLDGVTGSGKTEVYFEAIAAAIATGGNRWCCCPRSR